MSQSNSIFVGLADTECSILKFIDQVLSGEGENAPKPYWAGIDKIQNILTTSKTNIATVKSTYETKLSTAKGNIVTPKGNFKSELSTQSGNVNDKSTDSFKYIKVIDEKNYILDIINDFGSYTDENTNSGFLQNWYLEFIGKDTESSNLMSNIESNFQILKNDGQVDAALDEGIQNIEPIKTSFDEVKDQISDMIIGYSDTIDKYGKLAFKIVFSALMILDAAIAVLMLIMFFFLFLLLTEFAVVNV